MGPLQKRAILSWAYPGSTWLEKLEKMTDGQVHNIYMRLLNSGKLKGIDKNVKHRER